MRKEKFNHGWVFHKGGGSSLEALAGGGAANEQPVTLPHDASVGMTRNPDEPGGSGNGFFPGGVLQLYQDLFPESGGRGQEYLAGV